MQKRVIRRKLHGCHNDNPPLIFSPEVNWEVQIKVLHTDFVCKLSFHREDVITLRMSIEDYEHIYLEAIYRSEVVSAPADLAQKNATPMIQMLLRHIRDCCRLVNAQAKVSLEAHAEMRSEPAEKHLALARANGDTWHSAFKYMTDKENKINPLLLATYKQKMINGTFLEPTSMLLQLVPSQSLLSYYETLGFHVDSIDDNLHPHMSGSLSHILNTLDAKPHSQRWGNSPCLP